MTETSDLLFFIFKLLTALGCELVAGVFFAFSTFIMSALAKLQPPQGIATMQFINITVINPWFMTAFLGTAVAGLGLMGFVLFRLSQPNIGYVFAGGLLYLTGTLLVTMVCNVPLNNELAIADPHSPAGAKLWASYLIGLTGIMCAWSPPWWQRCYS